jgi:hypothetical protein
MKKVIILSAAVFLLAAGCNKTQLQSANEPVSQSVNQQSVNQPISLSAGQQQAASPTAIKPLADAAKAPTITVTQAVDGSKFNKLSDVIPAGENAVDLLKADHQIDTKSYSGIGEMVLSIDGVAPDSKHFWEFFVNGKSSNVGASSYVLKAGDKIEWKLSEIK